ncbi:hypothetical protein ACFL6M_05100 [Candidatus Eisenbacteria bacterium]|uniref:Uncharacterized protein n=1 Tax=Eiseniibacteriota bacterium TaxID=2212470 RepID=A0ABV6YLA7_UNCEI
MARKRCSSCFRWILLLVTAVCALVATGPGVVATTLLTMDVPALSEMADCVLEGEIRGTRCVWNETHTQIHTYVSFDVTTVHAGECTPGTREFRMLGGAVADTAMIVDGSPSFGAGERVFLFMRDESNSNFPIVGWKQGKLTFTIHAETSAERIGNVHVGYFDRDELIFAVQQAREGR